MMPIETESKEEASGDLRGRCKSLLPSPDFQAPQGPPIFRTKAGITWQSRNVICQPQQHNTEYKKVGLQFD